MSSDAYMSDMEDRTVPPSLVDESSITIHLPSVSVSSSEGRSSPCKAPSLSSQSDIYTSSDKDDGQSDKESTHQYEDKPEDTHPNEFLNKVNKKDIARTRYTEEDMSNHRSDEDYFRSEVVRDEDISPQKSDEEYFRPMKKVRQNMVHDEENHRSDEYYRSIKKLRQVMETREHHAEDESDTSSPRPDEEYFRPIKKLRMVNVPHREMVPSPPKPLTSFFIKDILNHKPTLPRRHSASSERAIVRPWDLGAASASSRRRPRSADDDSRSEKSETDSSGSPGSVPVNASPLDALFEMTSKAFEGLDADEKSSDPSRDHLSLFSNRVQPKKKRKSRTAFTNHQIFELEKRFLYQKYLSPADRDEIAQSLGLTNAQVITWFQNRRAKLKRDMEELKKDVDAAKVTGQRTILATYRDMNNIAKQNLSNDTDS